MSTDSSEEEERGLSGTVQISLTFRVSVPELASQKQFLLHCPTNPLTESDWLGFLSLIDYLQDAIVEQRLAAESTVFPYMEQGDL